MDVTEYERFNEYTYPKLKQLLDAKTKLIEARHHAPLVYRTKSIRSLDLMQFEKFDVMVLKLPLDTWNIDELLNSVRMDLLADSPSLIVVGCGSTIKGLQLGRKMLKEWGFRRAEDIVWLQKSPNGPKVDEKKPSSFQSVFNM